MSGSSNSENSKPELIPGFSSIDQFTKDGFKTLMEAIKHSNALPTSKNWNYYNAFESFGTLLNFEGNKVLHLMNRILRDYDVDSNIKNKVLDEKVELVIEANDAILEKVANNIDEMNGIRKNVQEPVCLQTVSAQVPINASWNKAQFSVDNSMNASVQGQSITLLTGKNIIRPQKFFKDKIDNSTSYPWKPRITDKPNSLKPLAIFLEEYEDRQEFSHPYEIELEKFAPLPDQLLVNGQPPRPKSLQDTPLIEVTNPDQLGDLVEALRNCKEFAVDVEHHSYRSFMGITCLLQISTSSCDYLIDTLILRDKLQILNEVFTKPTIVKIFHGAEKDIEWLQRDLSIYVVNMFDTFQAAKILEYPRLSLAFLMNKFCDFMPNKQFQLADWRIRPLPNELKSYAREDTHYLIYIYEMLKIELLKKNNGLDNLLRAVFERSTNTCKKRYFKPMLRDDSHMDLYVKCRRMFDNRQLFALKQLYQWRDQLAREEDESIGYILPNHMLLQISEALPREMQGILACCNPIPPLVRSNLLELHKIILKAREQPVEKPILKEDTRARGTKQVSKLNIDSPLYCPHDLSQSNEFRDDLPTLLSSRCIKRVEKKLGIEKTKSIYSVFNSSENICLGSEYETFKKIKGLTILSPFERYKLVKPFIQVEVDKAKELEEVKNKNEAPTEETSDINNGIKPAMGDNRTNEERIESIREHYVEMCRKFQDQVSKIPAESQSESKKRKRSCETETTSINEQSNSRQSNNPQTKKKKPNQQSNQPRIGKKQLKKMRKKQQQIKEQNNVEKNKAKIPAHHWSNYSKKKVRDYDFRPRVSGSASAPNEQFMLSLDGYAQDGWSPHAQNAHNCQSLDFTIDNFQDHQWHNRNNFPVYSGSYHMEPPNMAAYPPVQDNFQSFDYSAVDFREFQGGAKSVGQPQNVRSNFKAKKRNKMKNRGEKAAIFRGNRRGGRN